MNQSSSFELSSDVLDLSFKEYDTSAIELSLSEQKSYETKEIKHPVKKKVNELVKLQVKSNMSLKTVQKVIDIINDVPGSAIEIPNSPSYIKRNVSKLFDAVYFVNCAKCGELSECPGTCAKCKEIVQKNEKAMFAYIPIEQQIKKALHDNFEEISIQINQPQSQSYRDACDGNIQRNLSNLFPRQKILSLTLNIDGGRVAEQSTSSLWPIQLYQNYLPPLKRYMPENILVAGLYYGENKPNPFDLLYPLLRDLRQLFDDGIQLIYGGKVHDFLPLLVYCCCDLQARAPLQRLKQSNGKFACPVCLQIGYPDKKQKPVIYRYGKESVLSSLRTHSETVAHAHSKTNGVKGLSCLMSAPHFDIIHSFATDYMHGCALGVMKRLLKIILGDIKVETPFAPMTNSNQDELNRRICALKPYAKITHRPRTLQAMGSFRAIEYKYFMFFYLRYCLRNLIPHKYVAHFELFSAAIYILCKKTVEEEDIQKAETMLTQFCDQFEEYYGLKAVTINLHLLRHYGSAVRNTGPLWCHSLFAFEANMGILTEYARGSVHVVKQVTEKYIISKSSPHIPAKHDSCTFSINQIIDQKYDDLMRSHGLLNITKKATSVTINNQAFKSVYSNTTNCIDYFLEMKDGIIGCAVFYPVQNNEIFVLLKVYDIEKENYHLSEVAPNSQFAVYPIEAIKEKLLYLKFGPIEVVSKDPNFYERS